MINVPLRQKYYAVLVTTNAKHSFGWLSDYLCAEADLPPRIEWESRDTTALPPMRDFLAFRRHFALCLVKKEVWESTHVRLIDKFADQPFWDYYGRNSSYTIQQTWTDGEISKINGIQSLGIIRSDGNVLQEFSNCKSKPLLLQLLIITRSHLHYNRPQSTSEAVEVPLYLVELCRLRAMSRRPHGQRNWCYGVSRYIASASEPTGSHCD